MLKPPEALVHRLDRRVVLGQAPAAVFRYFADSALWARWFGEGSTIEARPGGALLIKFPGGVEVRGTVKEATAPTSIAFTYGYTSGTPVPPDGSWVSVALKEHDGGTKLRLSHAFAAEALRDGHVQGWRYQLAVLANLAANEAYAHATDTVDDWFAAWSDPDEATRNATIDRSVSPDVELRDQFSLVLGVDDLRPHLAAVHRFMPGTRIVRAGAIRHCQGTVLANWVATGPDGTERGQGTNVFNLDPAGRISSVVGLWGPA